MQNFLAPPYYSRLTNNDGVGRLNTIGGEVVGSDCEAVSAVASAQCLLLSERFFSLTKVTMDMGNVLMCHYDYFCYYTSLSLCMSVS